MGPIDSLYMFGGPSIQLAVDSEPQYHITCILPAFSSFSYPPHLTFDWEDLFFQLIKCWVYDISKLHLDDKDSSVLQVQCTGQLYSQHACSSGMVSSRGRLCRIVISSSSLAGFPRKFGWKHHSQADIVSRNCDPVCAGCCQKLQGLVLPKIGIVWCKWYVKQDCSPRNKNSAKSIYSRYQEVCVGGQSWQMWRLFGPVRSTWPTHLTEVQ